MLDIKFIRENTKLLKQACINKNIDCNIDRLLELDQERKIDLKDWESFRSEQKKANQTIARANFQDKAKAISSMQSIAKKVKELDSKIKSSDLEYNDLLLSVPQPALEEVPIGKDDSFNIEIKKHGEIPKFDFEIKDHLSLGEKLDMIDRKRAVKVSGARSYILKNKGILLMEALMSLARDILIEDGFSYLHVPHLVNKEAMIGTGYFPFGKEDSYELDNGKKFLIGTAEVVLTAYHSNEILSEKELPIKLCGKSECYRKEAGTYGKDTAGLYRVHQFTKLEQVILCKNDPKESAKWHQYLVSNAEKLMQALKLPYRIVKNCTGDIGAGQVKKHDIEAWMPSRNKYGETHSCSTFYEFQSRRLNMKYKDENGENHFVHTLNNTMIASPRILIPIMELYQKEDGSIEVPEVLRPYLNGLKTIEQPKS